MLCIHGITSSRASWTRFAQRFSTRFRVYAYDQRGHGDSAAVRGPMTLERSSRDLANVAAAIGDPIDVLVGHSWGGAVALRGGAVLQPRGVVAIDPMIRVAPGTFAADYVDDLRPLFALAGEARSSEIAQMYASSEPADRAAKLHAMQHMAIEALEALGRENRADERAFVRECGGPKVTTRVFDGQGHNLQRTAFDAFAEAVQEFFSKIGL